MSGKGYIREAAFSARWSRMAYWLRHSRARMADDAKGSV